MTTILGCLLVGGLFTGAVYLLLSRSAVRLVFGLFLLGHAVNLLVFFAAGATRGEPPLVAPDATAPPAAAADPVPQALVLTAIVIGFALTSFAAVLVRRASGDLDTADVDTMRGSDT
jgi:multicomponent Na+:H+ antiporter subunit C